MNKYKIAKGIDLKTLSKYHVNVYEDDNDYEWFNDIEMYVNSKSRKFVLEDLEGASVGFDDLFDMIKAGIVVKD